MKKIKYIKRQDSGWKQASSCSGETSINLSNDIFDFLSFGMVDAGEECGISFNIYREDFVNALSFIKSQLPLFRSTSQMSMMIQEDDLIFNKLQDEIYYYFGDDDVKEYTVTLYCRKDGRIYLKGLKQNGFSIRNYLVEMSSVLVFERNNQGFDLRLDSAVCEGDLSID